MFRGFQQAKNGDALCFFPASVANPSRSHRMFLRENVSMRPWPFCARLQTVTPMTTPSTKWLSRFAEKVEVKKVELMEE